MSYTQGWLLTILSSLLCVLGCLVIYFENVYYFLLPKSFTSKFPIHLKDNYMFLNGSMAFSSGCLLFTSLYRLLPESSNYFAHSDNISNDKWLDFCVIVSYATGVTIYIVFNYILHLVTSESVVHCVHEGEPISSEDGHSHGHGHSHSIPNDSHSHNHSHTQIHSHDHSHQHLHDEDNHLVQSETSHNENEPLVGDLEHSETSPLLARKKSLLHYFVPADHDVGECKGYSSAELCLFHNKDHPSELAELHFCEIPQLTDNTSLKNSNHLHPVRTHDSAHHHHVTSPVSRLFLIGIQTALAITLHKFPEGFITFVTSETNPDLGITIFLSLLLHNFTEGFSICLPLYYSFSNGVSKRYAKFKALTISALLAGCSQPLGAIGGYIFLKMNHVEPGSDLDTGNLNFIFGITIAMTSGFLSVVALSMYGSAISFGGSINFVMIWCVLGMVLIGLSSIYAQ